MAIIDQFSFRQFLEGSDLQRSSMAFSGTAPTLIADIAGAGAQSIQMPAGNNWIRPPLEADPGTEWCLHFWLRISAIPGSNNPPGTFIGLSNAAGVQGVNLRHSLNNFGAPLFQVGNGGTQLGSNFTMTGNIVAAPWRIHVVEHSSTGTVAVYRGNDLLYQFTGNTSRANAGDRFHFQSFAGGSATAAYGHVILTDGEDLGMAALVDLLPFAFDGDRNEWDRSNGAIPHYEHLEQAPHDGDATTLTSDADGVGEVTEHRVVAPSLTNRKILSARQSYMMQLEEEGADRVAMHYNSGSAETVTHIVGGIGHTGYQQVKGPVLNLDPDTDELFTPEGLAAMVNGLEHLAPEE